MPDRVFLLRGNHETEYCTMTYGFQQEVLAKYGDKGQHVYEKCLDCFKELPLASIIAGCVYTAHGGLFRKKRGKKILGSLEDLSKANRKVLDPTEEKEEEGQDMITTDVLWSDPTKKKGLFLNTKRGVGCLWGPNCTKDFLVNSEKFLKKSKLKVMPSFFSYLYHLPNHYFYYYCNCYCS